LEALASEPIATVLSIGCGLDARPWRLDLPAELRWIEVDFPDMLDYKEGLLRDEAPRCRRERLPADVTDAAQRRALYAAAGSAPALMITEGLLMYLPAATIELLATEPPRECGITNWIADITTEAFQQAINCSASMQRVRQVRASDSLEGGQI